MPAFVSTLCICIVFVPVIFLTGAARYLFTPLALAVVLAMMASYFLSRTLVPTMVKYLLAAEVDRYGEARKGKSRATTITFSGKRTTRLTISFDRFREGYRDLLASALDNRKTMAVGFGALCLVCLALDADHRHRLLPAGGRRADSFARPRARRYPDRRNRALVLASGRLHPARDPAERIAGYDRRHRPALQRPQHRHERFRDHRAVRRRDSGFAESGKARPDLGLCPDITQTTGARLSQLKLLLSARGYRRTDFEFRTSRAD